MVIEFILTDGIQALRLLLLSTMHWELLTAVRRPDKAAGGSEFQKTLSRPK